MRLAVADIAGGAESLSEIDLERVCRRFGLASPARQRVRRDARGNRRYLDAEWDLPDGRSVHLEVDGAHHLEVVHWDADIKRERRLAIADHRRTSVRCTAVEVRLDAKELAVDLAALGVPQRRH